jgi:hypothetical protein
MTGSTALFSTARFAKVFAKYARSNSVLGVSLASLVLVSLLFSCANNKLEKPINPTSKTNSSPTCFEGLSDTISFHKQIIPILTENCALPSCHSSSRPEGNLNLEASVAYVQITRPSRGYLYIIEPESSLLYNSLTSPANLMPPTGKMPDCKIDLIMKWMKQGALNN